MGSGGNSRTLPVPSGRSASSATLARVRTPRSAAASWLAIALLLAVGVACASDPVPAEDPAARTARREADSRDCRSQASNRQRVSLGPEGEVVKSRAEFDQEVFDRCMSQAGWETRPDPREQRQAAHRACVQESCKWGSCADVYGRLFPDAEYYSATYGECMERRGFPEGNRPR